VNRIEAHVVESDGTGKQVVLLTFATPKATPEQILALTPDNAGQPDVTAPGLVYRLLINAVFQRDAGWLSTTPREVLEQLANG
jgi:hypothetical protein